MRLAKSRFIPVATGNSSERRLHHAESRIQLRPALRRARVELDRHTFDRGPYKSKASILEFDRLITEWLANGRRLPVILHSRADDVVPFADSEELVVHSGLPAESLIEVGLEHRLADEESLEAMLNAVERDDNKVRKSAGHKAAVHRRFGIRTLLIITAMYGVLFGGLRYLQVSRSDFLLVVLFVTAIGLGQVLLFKGRHRLRASAIVGAILFPCIIVGIMLNQRLNGKHFTPRYPFLVTCLLLMALGALLGYLEGLVVTGLFLMAKRVRCWRVMPQAGHHVEETDASPHR